MALREPWRTRVLWLSVAGNLFGAALIGAHLATREPRHVPGMAAAAERMARDLSPADAALFRASLERERPWWEMARRRMNEARLDLSTTIERQPYDETAVRAQLDQFNARWAETNGRFGESLLTAIATLSPEGRAKIADATRNSGPK